MSSSHARALRLALFLAAGLGTGCGEKEVEDDTGNTTGGGGESGSGEGGGEEGGGEEGGGSGSGLEEVPEADYPVCDGDSGMSVGPCCVDVYCLDAEPDGSCLPTDELTAAEITGKSLGSGECECEAPAGPYAPYDGKEGDCCYTVGVQGCEGRPLLVGGLRRTARLVRGRSWTAA